MASSTTPTGRFRFTTATDRWWWSDDVYAIHGMDPGDVVPTRAVVLAHAVPEDRERVASALDSCAGSATPSTCEYRLRDLQDQERTVLMTLAYDDSGPDGPSVTGFLVDRTAALAAAVAQRVDAQLMAALESHAVIDQAKGVLMLTYGVDAGSAFELLRSTSQERNVRLRALAERVVESAQRGTEPETRERLDGLVSSALAQAAIPPPVADDAPLRLARDSHAGVVLLRVAGRVDLATKDGLGDAVALMLDSAKDQGRMLLDVRAVRPVSTALSDVLCAALRRATARGITLTIVGGHAHRDAGDPRLSVGAHATTAARA
ncbi:hypothetical protein Cch01nite_07720 [Cellulomonas chitinilytica]|uniref:ANTAR domain-containing protein n=1 Tax=Cellulomonas chitinilytica TaxID=398759 RepID=A0A919TYS8_9CELL|nr:PAS and ANTAR domain-containing protein [Cellulomonas chitinilytica]GIG20048.1 hypothetical protein Cch01nite_07720 [Cellulomonas chitinilytica]